MRRAVLFLTVIIAIASTSAFAQRTTTQAPRPGGLFTLTVVTNPAGASVFVNGGAMQGNSMKLPGGVTYKILVQAPGYADFNTTVALTKDTTIQASLSATGVQLTVIANVAGALVLLNGNAAGSAPLAIQVPPGNYTVTVRAKGYSDFTTRFTLNGPQTINAVLQVETFPLSVNSNVKGAMVYINGNLAGTAPLVLQLVPGSYFVAVKASGYEDFSFQVLMDSDQVVNAILSQSSYSLNITTNVKGAQVFLNGNFAGSAPGVFQLVPGSYFVTVKAPGYYDFSSQVALNGKQDLFANLQSMSFQLTVESNVLGAQIGINGAPAGTIPFAGLLAPGSYQILVKAPGYQDFSASVVLSKDLTVNAVLQPLLASFQVIVMQANANMDLKGNHLAQIKLSIDGIEQKALSGTVTPGEHALRVVSGGMQASSSYLFEAGKSYKIIPTMQLIVQE